MSNKSTSGILLTLLIGFIYNLWWSIPAWVLLILHFAIDLAIVWFWVALGVWVLLVIVSSLFIRFANKCSQIRDPEKKNINPYSHKNSNFLK